MTLAAQVFISYSSADEQAVRAALEPLRAEGVRLWFAPDHGCIPAGADFAAQIIDGLNASRALVLMATRRSMNSDHVARELELAAQKRLAIIPLFLEVAVPVPPAFEYRLATLQRITAHDEANPLWREHLLEALRHHGVFDGPAPPSGGQSYVLPYLADRDTQEHLLEDHLAKHLSVQPQRPLVVIAHGTHVQCSDFFGDRLLIHSLPRMLQARLGTSTLERKAIQWPNVDIPAEQRPRAYERFMTAKLEIAPGSGPEEVTRKIGLLRQPVVFHSSLTAAESPASEYKLIQAVVDYWDLLPDVPSPSQPLIVLLCVRYPEPPTSFFGRWYARAGAQNPPDMRGLLAALQRRAPRLQEPDEPPPTLLVLPELSNLSMGDVEAWVEDVLKPPDKDRVLAVVRALFMSPRKEAEQIIGRHLAATRGELAADLERMLRSPGPSRRLPMEPLVPFLHQFLHSQFRIRRL